MSKEKLISVSDSLCSTSRDKGPNLVCKGVFINHNESESDFGTKSINIVLNENTPNLYYEELKNKSSKITSTGALSVLSGSKTGRSPKDKRVVLDNETKDIWWGDISPNIKIDEDNFLINRESAICFLNNQDNLFVFDGFAGWDPNNRLKIRVICTRPYHALFMSNMLIKPTEDELCNFGKPDYTIYNCGEFPCNRYNNYMTSSTSIQFNLSRGEVLIFGTQYAGEMKKGIFSIMHFLMPKKEILSLHSSANQDKDGKVSLFFGLSGTGKTTLSADPDRFLIGDDEHCWTDSGIFNIEGGCYAKCINLDAKKEPLIYDCIKFGALVENVMMDKNHQVDFTDTTITQNTRVSYPLHYIKNNIIPAIGNHPKNIIFLTCDAFGILPAVSLLNIEQALYYFISGYTAKIAGTEQGITEPLATFSACFGEAFIVWHPMVYAEILETKLIQHDTNVWLVNTGWFGGIYGEGERYDIDFTRTIIDVINRGTIDTKCFNKLDIFNLKYISNIENLDSEKLDPRNNWEDKNKYDEIRKRLAILFKKNFSKYDKHHMYQKLVKHGPRF